MGRLRFGFGGAAVSHGATRGGVRPGGCRRAWGRRLALLLVLAPAVLAAAGHAPAQACIEFPLDWPLKPSAIGRGDSFRLMFITSRTTVPGTRSDILWYNGRVRLDMKWFGHRSIRSYWKKFNAVASTTLVDARDNTVSTYTDEDKGVPIYWLNGHRIADDYEDFYDGSWDSFIARNERGDLVYELQNVHVWTGSTANGTENVQDGVSRALGQRHVSIGRPWYNSGIYSGGSLYENDNAKHLYGLSAVLCIPSRVRLSWSPSAVEEGGGARQITVTATMIDGARAHDTTIRVSVGSGTAIAGTDFDEVADFDLNVTAGQTSGSASFTLTPVDDTLEEDDETVSITGAEDDLEVRTASGQGPLTIQDDDIPRVDLSWSPDTLDEDGGARQVTVTGTMVGATRPEDTTVRVSVGSGTAIEGTDFAEVADFNLTVTGGQTSGSASFSLTPVDDTLDEDNETVAISGAASGLEVGTASGQAALTIADDDTARVALSWTPDTLDEGGGARQVTVTATLTGATRPEDTTVRVSVDSGTAIEGTDFAEVADFDITVASGQTSSSASFTLTPVDDTLDEDNETVAIAGDAGGLEVGTASGQAALTIEDDDTARVELSWTPDTLDEDGGARQVTVTATLTGATRPGDTTVRISVGSGTAIEGTDFNEVADFDITVTGGQASGSASFTLTPVDDTHEEGDETVAISGAAGGLAVGTASGQGPLTIQDDDTTLGLRLSWTPSTLDEDGGARQVTVTGTLVGATQTEDVTVRVSVGSGTAIEGTDFDDVADFDLTVTGGQTSGNASFTLTPVDDTLDEADETVAVSGTADNLAVGTASGQGPLTIQDDDTAQVALSWSPDTLSEGGGARQVTVTATLTGATRSEDTTVRVSVGSGTAIEETDFAEVADFDITVTGGQTSGSAAFTLTPVDDTLDEDNETVAIAGTADGLAVGTVSGQAALTIEDDDTAQVELSWSPDTLDEGGGAQQVTVTATLTGATLPEDVTVRVSVGSGTAIEGTDFAEVADFDITVTGGQASGSASVTLAPVDDTLEEGDETVAISGAAGGLPVGTASGQGPLTIQDDDTALGLRLSWSPSTLDEGGGAQQVTVTGTLVGATQTENVTVRVSVGSGTAIEGTDFAEVADFDLTVTAGQASGSASFTLTPVDDTLEEADETVAIAGTTDNLAVGTASGQGPLTIQDDDTTLGLRLSWSPDTLDEGGGAQRVTVTGTLVGAARSEDTTVRVSVGSGTAIEGTDFDEVADFDLTVTAGQASGSATFTLTPVDDTLVEDDETVSISGTSANLAVGTASGQGPLTIQDDDLVPELALSLAPNTPDEAAFSVADAETREAPGATLGFVVTLSQSRTVATTVEYATGDGSATAGEDYVAASGTLDFAAGVTSRVVQVPVLDDVQHEHRETMTFTLSNPSPGARIVDGVATGTIEDRDSLLRVWIVRFGRMVGSQIVEALADRFERSGSHVTMGGARVGGTPESSGPRAPEPDARLGRDEENEPRRSTGTATMREFLRGSSFHAASAGDPGDGAAFAAWGNVAVGDWIDERSDGVDLDSAAVTGLIGVDLAWSRTLAGVLVSLSKGEGTYSAKTDMVRPRGDLQGHLTGAYPYLRFRLGEGLSAWGTAGAARGEVSLRPEGMPAFRADLRMQMGAAGLEGAILEPSGPLGTEVTLKSDAMWMRIQSDATAHLRREEGEATQVRLSVESESAVRVAEGATLTPSVEMGLRYDGADARDGLGVEIGAGLRFAANRISASGRVETLALRGRSGYREWRAGGSFHVAPDDSGRGVSLTMTPSWGPAPGGLGRLRSARDAAALAADAGIRPEGRLDGEIGYGLPAFGSRFTATPRLGFGLSRTGRDYSIGWTLSPARPARMSFDLGLEATRRRAANDNRAAHGFMLRSRLSW